MATQQTNISLGYGIRRTPSLGEAGELSEAMNLIPRGGELVNIQPPKNTGIELGAGETILAIHSVYGYKHYIVLHKGDNNSESLYYYSGQTRTKIDTSAIKGSITSITCIGNTIVVSATDGLFYYLWKDSAYYPLGNHIPNIGLSFGLAGDFVAYEDENLQVLLENGDASGAKDGLYVNTGNFGIHNLDSVGSLKLLSDMVYANINSAEAFLKKKGRFAYPFFVCYAIRLYDGSLTMQSIPVLMIPSTDGRPTPMIYCWSYDGKYKCGCRVENFASVLTVKMLNSSDLSLWSDIIESVDIFVSTQHQRYREDGGITNSVITRYTNNDLSESRNQSGPYSMKCIGSRCSVIDTSCVTSVLTGSNEYADEQFLFSSSLDLDRTAFASPASVLSGPSIAKEYGVLGESNYLNSFICGEPEVSVKNIDDWLQGIERESTLYLVKSLKLSELGTFYKIRRTIHIKEGVLDSLEAREKVTIDTGYSHDNYVSNNVLSYNSRLILTDTYRVLGNQIYADETFGYIEESSHSGNANIYVNIEYNGESYYVKLRSAGNISIYNGIYYFYYPDPHAKKIYIFCGEESLMLNLQEHPFLNGAYWFNRMTPCTTTSDKTIRELELLTGVAKVDQTNRVFISEVGNPFLFRGNLAVTLPDHVYATSTAAKALSQGQFGQFPLYAFCADGIWALTISDTGTLSAKQPISRDVVSNINSITQIDSAVVFVTKQGLKIISGSEVSLLSERISGINLNENFFQSVIPEELYDADTARFEEQLQSAKIVYDYPHNYLHIFMDNSFTHYVLDLSTMEFSKQKLSTKLTSVVPGYPLSTMQMSDNKLYEYDALFNNTARQGFIVTRSCAFGNPLSKKMLWDIRTLGQRVSNTTKFNIAVYISDDNVNWYRLSSLKMRSAKYYRFVVKTDMTDLETLSGLSVQFQERYMNKLRGDHNESGNT